MDATFQCNNCQHCNKDLSYRVTKTDPGQSESSDKVKMLLERLKRLEEEKSQLVLENENQGQQYEKCLDEIANHVVQALLSQKVSMGRGLVALENISNFDETIFKEFI